MRIARLPDGSLIEFPPDFPDDEMDRAVRGKLGLPEPVDQGQVLTQLLQAVTQQMAMMSEQIAQQQAALQQLGQMVGQVASATADMPQALSAGFSGLQAAYMADTILETDKSGKPVRTRKVI